MKKERQNRFSEKNPFRLRAKKLDAQVYTRLVPSTAKKEKVMAKHKVVKLSLLQKEQ